MSSGVNPVCFLVMLQAVGAHAQRQGLGGAASLGLGAAIGQAARQGNHVCQPAAVWLSLGFDDEHELTFYW